MATATTERRTEQVHAHLTPSELARLDALADATRLGRSQLLRLGLDRLFRDGVVVAGPPHAVPIPGWEARRA